MKVKGEVYCLTLNMADEQARFEALLQGLMSEDNESRTQNEGLYDKIPGPTKLPMLVQSMSNSNISIEIRTLSSVLLRRLFTNEFEEVWPKLSPELQTAVKEKLMSAITEELTPPVRRKVCDATAELARNMIDDEENMNWPEVLKFMFESASSPDSGLRESALHIFKNVPGIFGKQQSHYMDVIKQMLSRCLADRDNPQVWFEAIKASTAFLVANDKNNHLLHHFKDLLPPMIQLITTYFLVACHKNNHLLHHFKDLLPPMIQGMNESLSADDDSLMKCLIELAENVPKFLRPQMDNIIPFCLKVISDANLSDSMRQLGMEAIVTLSETAPAMVRKFGKYMPLLVPQVLALMVDLEEEEDWSIQDEPEEEDTESNSIAAESALDRLACALGGKTMLPHILANIPQMLQNGDWRYRHAALMAISACAEGCHQQMEGMLNNILDAVLPFLKDPHPRVRYAGCNAIGQLCRDFGPLFQKKYHNRVVPELLQIMDDNGNPRVQSHGAAALVNFAEECPKIVLSQYLDVILNKMEQVLSSKFKELLEKGVKLVLEQVVTALASVADTVEEKFTQYYDRFMPCLKYIMQNAVTKEMRLLRGKTIECISLIGLAVGKEKFLQDCSDVMQMLLKTQTDLSEMEDDDPQISYMISAWARMCKILGKEFQQYLPLVMPPVLKAASLKPEVALLDSDEIKDMQGDTDWEFVNVGEQQSFGIRTAGLEEKTTACQMLVCYARELKEGFAEYAEEVVKTMVPLLKFYFEDDIRIAASESLPFLIDCAKIRGDQYVAEMWNYICPSLLKAIEIEPEQSVLPEHLYALSKIRGDQYVAEMWNYICPSLLKAIEIEPEQSVLPEHLYALSKCIEKLGKGCLSQENMNLVISLLEKQLQSHFKKQEERHEKRKDEDYDEDLEEDLLEEVTLPKCVFTCLIPDHC
ncbi:IPO5 [Mytilus coruscus]|uniref:IPO5 n=1 Tax=Mytilus coruscus TaxID=42192 RepID=A0A6J8CAX3_MYTCO|nr:IPO5 [Mytilus coruscus]